LVNEIPEGYGPDFFGESAEIPLGIRVRKVELRDLRINF